MYKRQGHHIIDDETFDQAGFLKLVASSPECPKSSCPSPERYMPVSYTHLCRKEAALEAGQLFAAGPGIKLWVDGIEILAVQIVLYDS